MVLPGTIRLVVTKAGLVEASTVNIAPGAFVKSTGAQVTRGRGGRRIFPRQEFQTRLPRDAPQIFPGVL